MMTAKSQANLNDAMLTTVRQFAAGARGGAGAPAADTVQQAEDVLRRLHCHAEQVILDLGNKGSLRMTMRRPHPERPNATQYVDCELRPYGSFRYKDWVEGEYEDDDDYREEDLIADMLEGAGVWGGRNVPVAEFLEWLDNSGAAAGAAALPADWEAEVNRFAAGAEHGPPPAAQVVARVRKLLAGVNDRFDRDHVYLGANDSAGSLSLDLVVMMPAPAGLERDAASVWVSVYADGAADCLHWRGSTTLEQDAEGGPVPLAEVDALLRRPPGELQGG